MFTNRFSKILVAAMLVVAALATISFTTKSSHQSADRSYDGVEQMRNQRPAVSSAVMADRGYDQVEQLRISRPTTSIAAESIDDAIESLRTVFASWQLHPATTTVSPSFDRSYDGIENFRAHGRVP